MHRTMCGVWGLGGFGRLAWADWMKGFFGGAVCFGVGEGGKRNEGKGERGGKITSKFLPSSQSLRIEGHVWVWSANVRFKRFSLRVFACLLLMVLFVVERDGLVMTV